MSLSSSDCLSSSDLICGEDSAIVFSKYGDYSPEYASDIESALPEFEDSINQLLEEERNLTWITSRVPIQLNDDATARAESVAWILKVQNYYGFWPLTAFLSVNFFDRFLLSHPLPANNGWPQQLLSVACLSLAAKLEEPLVPSLLDLQVGNAKFIFEPRTIKRMELLVLTVLDWKLRCISPFCYLKFLSLRMDPSGTYSTFIASKAKEIILATLEEISFIEFRPSCIAAAAAICAANTLPNLSVSESWSKGLHKDDIMNYYQILHEVSIKPMVSKQQSKVAPQVRVMNFVASSDSCSTSSSSCKKRKLNTESWEEEKKGSGY